MVILEPNPCSTFLPIDILFEHIPTETCGDSLRTPQSSGRPVPLPIIGLLVGGAVCAAVGQLLFAAGAQGRTGLLSFLNLRILTGFALYAVSSLFWIYSLSRARLIQVYPFTVLTFVLIYLGSAVILGQRLSMPGLCGVALVLAGLYLLSIR